MSLSAKNLGFYYNKNEWIFRDVNFELAEGECMGIFGYSGCGKTSLAKIMADFIKPKEGSVEINKETHKEREYRKVQLIYQHPEKIMNPLWRMRDILEESYTPDKELLELFGIRDEWQERYPIELSSGELQRFSIVRALNPKTKYLIADEMTTMLDGITQANIWKNLLEIVKKRNLGLIVISHESKLIEKICHKILFMEENRLVNL